MSFYTFRFLFFLIAVITIYYAVPERWRYLWVLTVNYFFCLTWGCQTVIILLLVTIAAYIGGILLNCFHQKIITVIFVVGISGILWMAKYLPFTMGTLNRFFAFVGIQTGLPEFHFVQPMGISFFTLQAIGYLIDVYQRRVEAEKHFFKFAMFLSFFPVFLSGPIERSTNLLQQINRPGRPSWNNFQKGFFLLFWGIMQKLWLADHIATVVDNVFQSVGETTGSLLAVTVLLYGIQIYCDFAAYSSIALGVSKMMGFDILINFRQPYLALTVKDFWRRWHISLSSWLRDYIYIPLGGNRKGQLRKYMNLLITFLISGLWHGASWHFFFWGALHGMMQIIGDITAGARNHFWNKVGAERDCFSFKLHQRLCTFLLIDVAWIFFRVEYTGQALTIIRKICVDFKLADFFLGRVSIPGWKVTDLFIVCIGIIIVLIIDSLHERSVSIMGWFRKQNSVFRWCVYLGVCLILTCTLLREYGTDASAFIYTRF